MKTESFKDLIVWQKAYKLVLVIYRMSENFPPNESFGLTQQMRRAAVSILSNIVEGYGRFHNKEYMQFLSVAKGSLCELETQCLLAVDLKYTAESLDILALINEISKMLHRMAYSKR